MAWPCRLIFPEPEDMAKFGMPRNPNVGDMWIVPLEQAYRNALGVNYFRDWEGKRGVIVVYMPGGWHWLPDNMATSGGQRSGEGWKVTGEPPMITTSPSINAQGIYHGYIVNGVITDDVDGRRFSEDGKTQL